MNPDTFHTPPAYFIRDGESFTATGLARSPWTSNALAGGPVSALLAAIFDAEVIDPDFNIARYSVDILGLVPNQTLLPRITALRQGRQMQLYLAELLAGGRSVARAHILLVRVVETPTIAPPMPYPLPDTLIEGPYLVGATMAGAIRCKAVLGGVLEPGRGIVWLAMDGEIIAGTPPSPFVKAALFADFGGGVGSAVQPENWSYANLDITLQFLRMPHGEWQLIDAETTSTGNGHATATNVFADAEGIYARGFQTLFIEPTFRR